MTDTTSTTATEPTAAEVAATIDAYLAMWNEDDPTARAALIATAWTDDGAYTDPLLAATGAAELSAMVDAVHGQYPGARFRRTTAIDSHHAHHRFGWQLGEGDATVVAGLDVAELAADGRLARITGFFGDLAGA